MDPVFQTILYWGFAAILVCFFIAIIWIGFMTLSSLFK